MPARDCMNAGMCVRGYTYVVLIKSYLHECLCMQLHAWTRFEKVPNDVEGSRFSVKSDVERCVLNNSSS